LGTSSRGRRLFAGCLLLKAKSHGQAMINIATSEILNTRRPEFEAYLLASSAQRQVTIVAI
jgi:hypothetical protein